MTISVLRLLALLSVLGLPEIALASSQWTESSDGTFIVLTAAAADEQLLPQVFRELQAALRDLQQQPGMQLAACSAVTVRVHPDLSSYTRATQLPWFVLASADQRSCELQLQRLAVVRSAGSLRITLRHELFHLLQPAALARWEAEGRAMLFAGEQPSAPPLQGITPAQLDELLASPPDRALLARAAATAHLWVRQQPWP